MDRMKILVIDNLIRNQQSAQDLFEADHDLIVCESVHSIYELPPILNKEDSFDIIMASPFLPDDSLGVLMNVSSVSVENRMAFAINMAMKYVIDQTPYDLLDSSLSHFHTLGLKKRKNEKQYDIGLAFIEDHLKEDASVCVKNWTIVLSQLLQGFS